MSRDARVAEFSVGSYEQTKCNFFSLGYFRGKEISIFRLSLFYPKALILQTSILNQRLPQT